MAEDPKEGREKALRVTLDALSHARNLLSEWLEDENKLRQIAFIRRAYFDVEFSIGLGRFLVKDPKRKSDKLRNLDVSKKNNPLLMPLDSLREKVKSIISDLEFAEYDFETATSERGLESARKARDELKVLILAAKKETFGIQHTRPRISKGVSRNPK